MTDTALPSVEWSMKGKRRMIKHPDTGEMVPVQRVSTFAKTLDSGFGLIPWMGWNVVKGSFVLPEMAKTVAESESTPKELVEMLAEAGGSKEAAIKGQQRHNILAMALLGHALPAMETDQRTELDAILALIESLGEPIAVEAPTASLEYETAGTCDLVLRNASGQTFVCDFKTGRNIDMISCSLQLIVHARSRFYEPATNRWGDLVAEDKPRLVIIHAPQTGSLPKAIEMPLDHARDWAECAKWVRRIRSESRKMGRAI